MFDTDHEDGLMDWLVIAAVFPAFGFLLGSVAVFFGLV